MVLFFLIYYIFLAIFNPISFYSKIPENIELRILPELSFYHNYIVTCRCLFFYHKVLFIHVILSTLAFHREQEKVVVVRLCLPRRPGTIVRFLFSVRLRSARHSLVTEPRPWFFLDGPELTFLWSALDLDFCIHFSPNEQDFLVKRTRVLH